MEFMTVDKFLYDKPYYNNIIALRVQDEKVYFVGWMEDAKNYKISWMNKGNELDLSSLLLNYNLYKEITELPGYNTMEYGWETDDDGHVISEEESEDEYQAFIDLLNDGYKIFGIGKYEICDIIDSLKDGDYVFIIEGFGTDKI